MNLLETAKELINNLNQDEVTGVNLVEDELENGQTTISINIRIKPLKNENTSLRETGQYYDD